ncbi:cbb3-type cytochrome c oxidase subunit I [Agriterribacter sp.]|uniref:cbb3-type cytochrome c oxidase subunit I n=1 Tax=Agriterribacter sp. TaxID=2821509 RepID=UPI002BFDE857|nr:cbb3-type cytochrome c oxidase subunit I [Agriterribacter sp.]HRO48012.1 cbb3-type cytochrome c oxidase subunit I [Agriterribacter sp.]HRQ19333.1 cbb3-type cytochrome c oxidase subunit I [Agriterribacter sp.]
MKKKWYVPFIKGLLSTAGLISFSSLYAQTAGKPAFYFTHLNGLLLFLFVLIFFMLATVLYLKFKTGEMIKINRRLKQRNADKNFDRYITDLNSKQIEAYLNYRKDNASTRPPSPENTGTLFKSIFILLLLSLNGGWLFAQETTPDKGSVLGETGIIITIVLLLIPISAGIIFMVIKVLNLIKQNRNRLNLAEADQLAEYLSTPPGEDTRAALLKRKEALDYTLTHNELSGNLPPQDTKGLISSISVNSALPVVVQKKRAAKRPNIDPELSKLVLWYIGSATFWLLFGTTVGEYLGIKFVAPDADQVSWLSFGRLRPVHTNAVFWGWASLGMLGLAYYTVPRVSNTKLASFKMGWYTLYLINASVLLGSICLMAGINNGGGEYREYIWPVMLLFGIGLVLTLINFLQTIAKRTTKEIYISNWYIVAALIFGLVITVVAYVPWWQDGLGETIIQGYYMHQGVGMWFMMMTLGLVYYYLPQQLNRPIYSYSLGILAYWTQILFYTLIGTHHFVFSSIPWWLQTIAIVGSVGMVIPVVAGSTNFIMTFKGGWHKISDSYTLPFFLVGIIFYFTGSLQGTAEAFRSTNLIWHFTDFTVAHSHLTMYGIISFFVWAGIYTVIPRLTGREAPQITVGAHFWFALIGLLFYTVPLMYGSTLKGLMWIEGKPFMESVIFSAPYWLWRAVGGSLMWIAHLFFAYNIYKMLSGGGIVDVKEAAFEKLARKVEGNI